MTLSRGALMYSIESLFMILPFIVVGYNVLLELHNAKRIKKRISLKSIPFLTFTAMELAILLRIIQGIFAYKYDVANPSDNVVFWSLYIWGVNIYTIQFAFVALCWVKLVVVFFENDTIHFERARVVDKWFFIINLTMCLFYVILVIFACVRPDMADYDKIWRLGFLVICMIIALVFYVYGSRLLKQLLDSKRQLDVVIVKKLKGTLFVIAVMVIICCIVPNIYWIWARHRPPQDWINFTLFMTEIFNITSMLILLGRTKLSAKLRILFRYPELIVSEQTSGTGVSQLESSNKSIELGSITISVTVPDGADDDLKSSKEEEDNSNSSQNNGINNNNNNGNNGINGNNKDGQLLEV